MEVALLTIMVDFSIKIIEFIAAAIGEEIYLNKDKLQQAFNMFDKVKA